MILKFMVLKILDMCGWRASVRRDGSNKATCHARDLQRFGQMYVSALRFARVFLPEVLLVCSFMFGVSHPKP